MKSKKGSEQVSPVLLWGIIAIISILIFLFFYQRLGLGVTNAEICHNSVFLQAKSATLAPGGLQCKTDYVCISGGGKCEGMNPTETIHVDPTNKQQILGVISDQMAQCWWMFGQGKLDYLALGQKGVIGSNTCAVCSVVGFDSTIQTELKASIVSEGPQSSPLTSYSVAPPLTYKDLMDYLETNTTTEGGQKQTYLSYLYGFYSVSDLLSKSQPVLSNFYSSEPIPLNGQYAILTGESKTSFTTIFFSQFPELFTGGTTPQYYFIPPMFIGVNNVTKYFGSDCGGNFVTQS